ACLAEPPAESPSTRNNSLREGSPLEQSASLPGKAGPWVTFLRAIFLLERTRFCALLMQRSASLSPSSVCWFNQRAKASLAMPETNAAASREVKRSLVWPENCGSASLKEST